MAKRDQIVEAGTEEETPPRLYANFLSIGNNMSEVFLDFGQFFSAETPPVVHTRLVTSPLRLRSFHELMGGALDRYEEEFGMLPDLDLLTRDQ